MMLRQNSEAQENLLDLVEDNPKFREAIDSGTFVVTYGIITKKPRSMSSDALPLFSRISLLRNLHSFQLMGVKAQVFLIKDNVDRTTKNKAAKESEDIEQDEED